LAFADGYAEGQAARERRNARPLQVIAMVDMPHALALSLLDPITNPTQIALDELGE
jgi:hypothetical protein